MTNPLVHTIVFVAAVIVPGGLLVYFAWRAARKAISLKADANQNDDFGPLGSLSEPDDAVSAFRRMFPRYPPDSLRARNRAKRLSLYKTRPRKKSQ
jgi:hypothetical protein